MKKVIMIIIGSLLFVAGYSYTRRQAEYAATQSTSARPIPIRIKTPVVSPFKTLSTSIFGLQKLLISNA